MSSAIEVERPERLQALMPNPLQQVMLDAPLNDVLVVATAKATGKTFGIVLLVLRDAQILKENYHCLITRSTFQALQELQTLLYRYLTQAYPGTTWNAGENTFRIGGRSAPFGTVELAYTSASPLEQIRALNRLQGRSKICAIHDEAGTQPTPDFYDQLQGVLRGPAGVPTRVIFLANPGGPGHHWLKERFAAPAGLPEPMKPRRFWSEEYEKHCIFLTANASINPHVDWQQYKRNVEIVSGGDPAMLAALLEGRWDTDLGGAFFASCWSPNRCRHAINPGEIYLRGHRPRPFVVMDHGYAAPTVAYLVVPNPPGIDAPKGTLLLADELYLCSSNVSGRRDWARGSCLPSSEQAAAMIEWLQRWGLERGDVRILADDAMWNSNGHISGSIAQEFRAAGVTLARAQKMKTPVMAGLQMLRNRMHAARRDETQPWLLWSPVCEGFEATVPSIPRHPRDPETIADGAIDHALDAVRYGVCWYAGSNRSESATTSFRIY
ncbi:hypothetical protein [Cyanobium sp. PCC 7001]|uniref:hypothetical protein n=1 Tax=Cyanobium sp. PCC 7001 TaxID=180281 RepID=UPI0012E9A60A|nr:hypothetical protein [Cyanobium sp. PCC 7001]